jgi:hypothetical protein
MQSVSTRPSLSALPDWSAVPSNSEDDRVLLNLRLAFYGRVVFLLTGAFYLFNLMLGLGRGVGLWQQISHPALVLQAAARAALRTESSTPLQQTVAVDLAQRAHAATEPAA